MAELERERKKLMDQKQAIWEETKAAGDKLRKAREEFHAANKAKDEASKKVDESVKSISQEDVDAVEPHLSGAHTMAKELVEEAQADGRMPDPKPATQASPASVEKMRPQTPRSNEDYEKKEKQRSVWEKIEQRVNVKKEEAAKQFKLGQYSEANKVYLSAAEQLEEALDDLPLFKKEICQLEASIFNNIAFCYGKDQHHRKEIEYTTKVLDRALYMDNAQILVKAYLRRGLAYEH
jgi:tetratricopeptide (TPR) repeat protein